MIPQQRLTVPKPTAGALLSVNGRPAPGAKGGKEKTRGWGAAGRSATGARGEAEGGQRARHDPKRTPPVQVPAGAERNRVLLVSNLLTPASGHMRPVTSGFLLL